MGKKLDLLCWRQPFIGRNSLCANVENKRSLRGKKKLFFFSPPRFDKNVTRAHACIRKLVAPPLFFFVVSIFFQSSQPAHEILRPIIG